MITPTTHGKYLFLASVMMSALILFVGPNTPTFADEPLKLTIQPVLSEDKTKAAFQPLADYLSRKTGRQIVIQTLPNFLAYWDIVRQPEKYDLALDAAHFTDYRASKLGYRVLVKIPDTVTYSLVTREDLFVFEPKELVGKRVATLGSPSIGAARFSAMFSNPVRQPILVEVANAQEGMAKLLAGKVDAAILPTPIISQQMAQGGGINVVITTEPLPHIALSISSKLSPALQQAIQDSLINADKTDAGKQMLQHIGFPKFDKTSAVTYKDQARILQDYWGY